MSGAGIWQMGNSQGAQGPQGPAGTNGTNGTNGHGSTVTNGTVTTSGGNFVVPVADGTAFANGAEIFVGDGTNSLLGSIVSGGTTNSITVHPDTTTGTVTSIANGSTFAWAGKTGATGATGPTGPTGPAGSALAPVTNTASNGSIDGTERTVSTNTFSVTNAQTALCTAFVSILTIAGQTIEYTIRVKLDGTTINLGNNQATPSNYVVIPSSSGRTYGFQVSVPLVLSSGSHTVNVTVQQVTAVSTGNRADAIQAIWFTNT